MLSPEDDEVRAAACSTIPGITKYMSRQEAFNTLFPIIIRLSNDNIAIKKSLSNNLLKLVTEFTE